MWCRWVTLGQAESVSPSEHVAVNVNDMLSVFCRQGTILAAISAGASTSCGAPFAPCVRMTANSETAVFLCDGGLQASDAPWDSQAIDASCDGSNPQKLEQIASLSNKEALEHERSICIRHNRTGVMRSVTLYSKGSITSEHNLFERLTGQLPLQPDGRTRLTVDIMSTAFLLVDSFLVHFTATWQLPAQGLLLVHAWISSIFRSSDLFFHFVSSRVTNNNLESSLRDAARGHLLSWFLADVMVLVTEWVHLCLTYIAVSDSGKEASLLKMMRFLKVARSLRALSAIQSARCSLLERRHIPIESEHMQPPGQP